MYNIEINYQSSMSDFEIPKSEQGISGVVNKVLDLLPPDVEQEIEDYLSNSFLGNFIALNIDNDSEAGTALAGVRTQDQLNDVVARMDPSVIPPIESVQRYSHAREVPFFNWCRLQHEGRERLYYCEPSTNRPGRVMVPADTMSFITGSMGYRPGQAQGLEVHIEGQLVPVRLPSTFTGSIDTIRVNPMIQSRLNRAFRKMEGEGIEYHVDHAGCFCFRGVRGLGRQSRADYNPVMSNHSLGMAIDFNPSTNEYSDDATTDMPDRMIAIMEENGFEWGGRWNTPDMMHFQMTPDDFTTTQS